MVVVSEEFIPTPSRVAPPGAGNWCWGHAAHAVCEGRILTAHLLRRLFRLVAVNDGVENLPSVGGVEVLVEAANAAVVGPIDSDVSDRPGSVTEEGYLPTRLDGHALVKLVADSEFSAPKLGLDGAPPVGPELNKSQGSLSGGANLVHHVFFGGGNLASGVDRDSGLSIQEKKEVSEIHTITYSGFEGL